MVNLKERLTKRNIAKPFLLGLHLKGLYIEFSQLKVKNGVFRKKPWPSRHMHSQGGVRGASFPFLKVNNFTKIIQKIKCLKAAVI